MHVSIYCLFRGDTCFAAIRWVMSVETRPRRLQKYFNQAAGDSGPLPAVGPAPWAFTVEDYHRMGAAAILKEDDRVELIEGEVVRMTPIGPSHMRCVNFLNRFLVSFVGDSLVVSIQNPIRLDEYSEPQPDVVLLRPHAGWNWRVTPGPRDVVAIVEVADTTLRYDRKVKLPMYALAGIPELWIVDLQGEGIERYTEPELDQYGAFARAGRDEQLESIVVPGLILSVNAVLGGL